MRGGRFECLRALTGGVVLTLVLGCMPVWGAADLGKALKYFDAGDYKPAVLLLKSALQKDPNDAEARFLLGRTYVRLGLGQAAEKELRWARRLGIEDSALTWPLGKAYLLQNKGKDLLSEFRVRDSMPVAERAELLTLRGQAEIADSNVREAKRLFEQALKIQPQAARARLGLAQLHIADKHYRAAIRQLDKAVRSDPACTECWVGMGEARRLQGDLDGAAQAFSQALTLEPKHPMANLGLATIAIERKDIEAAKGYLKATSETLPRHPLKDYLEAVIALDAKDLQTADEKVTQALKGTPSHPPSILLSGSIAFLQGQYAKAIEQLGRYSRLAEPTPEVRSMLAAAELEEKQPKQAIEWLRPLVQANKADARINALFAKAWQQLGDFDSAQRYLDKITQQAPDSTRARAHSAINRLMAGDSKGGISELEQLASDSGEEPGAEVLVVLAALQARDYARAEQAARRLIEKQAGKAMPWNLLGVAQLGVKQLDQARASFEQALNKDPTFITAALNLARMDARAGEVEAAKQRLSTLLKQQPDNVPTMLELALLAAQTGDAGGQMQWIRKALAVRPDSRDAGLALVKAQIKGGAVDAALNAARTLSDKYPEHPAVIRVLAKAQLAKGEVASAIANYRKLLRLQPDSAEVELRLATALARSGNFKQALEHAHKTLELAPDSILARERLVRITHASGDLPAALKEARVLQREWPDLAVGYVLEGDIHNSAKRDKEAISAYRKAYRAQPSSALALRMNQMLARGGQFQAGVVVLEDWLREHPADKVVHYRLASSYQRSGQMDAAAASYEALLKAQPDSVVALNNLALVYNKLGNSKALAMAEKAYQLAGKQVAVADTWGWLLVKAGRAAEAVKVLEAALSQDPKQNEIRYHLAAAYAGAGMKDKARGELQRLMIRSEDFPGRADAKALLKRLQ